MKKSLMFALAILLALVAAVPASARDNNRRSDHHRGGYVIPIPQIQIVGGGYYPSYGHRSRVGRFLHTVLAPEPYYPYGTRPYGYEEETAGKCFERVAKAAKKQKVEITAPEIAAFCSGQPMPEPQPQYIPQTEHSEPMPQAPPQVAQAPAPMRTPAKTYTVPRKPRGVYLEAGIICNDDHRPLTILVDGREVGVIAPGGTLTLSRLPAGKVCYVQEGKSSCNR